MTHDEMLVIQHGQEKIDKARAIAGDCQTGYLVFLDRETGRVFYQGTHSRKQVQTDFTREHVDIAWHGFQPDDPARIEWNRLNSEASGGKFDVYIVKGR
jgi:hypothetical protein